MQQLLTTKAAAEALGISQRRILALIAAGQLRAKKVGPVWTMRQIDLDKVRDRRPGRPRKGK